MAAKDRWSNKSHYPVFFLNHEFLIPFILFGGMLVTDKVELALAVMGIRVYDPDHIVPLLFYAGTTYIAVTYSFRSFMRWSRFRLSQQHPLINFILNISMAILPIAAIIINPLLLLPLLVIHWFSHVRSPDPEEIDRHLPALKRTYMLIVMQIILCFAAFVLVSFEVRTLQELTLWGWLASGVE